MIFPTFGPNVRLLGLLLPLLHHPRLRLRESGNERTGTIMTLLTPTPADLRFDVEYGYHFNARCEKIYMRLDFATNVVQLVGGSAAAAAALSQAPFWVTFAGVALAIAAAFAVLIQPGIKAEKHRATKALFIKLTAKDFKTDAAAIKATLADIQAEGLIGFRALQAPAFNDALQGLGYSNDGKLPTSAWQNLVSVFC